MGAIDGKRIEGTPPPDWREVRRALFRALARLSGMGLAALSGIVATRYGAAAGSAVGMVGAAVLHEVRPLLTGQPEPDSAAPPPR